MNPWDELSADFNTHKGNNDLHPDVADNVMLAWPSMFRAIESIQKETSDLNALDFGLSNEGSLQSI